MSEKLSDDTLRLLSELPAREDWQTRDLARELLDLRARVTELQTSSHRWELRACDAEGTVLDLRAEVERLKASVECEKNAGRDWMAWCEEAKQEATARTAEVAALTRALGERETKVEQLQEALSFFRSVIKSGEPWTDECEDAYRAALTEEGSDA